MMTLKPGTPCYLVNLREMVELSGRVVEVVAFLPDEDGDWYSVDASWVREEFPTGMRSQRHHLLPIVPPSLAPGVPTGGSLTGSEDVAGRTAHGLHFHADEMRRSVESSKRDKELVRPRERRGIP